MNASIYNLRVYNIGFNTYIQTLRKSEKKTLGKNSTMGENYYTVAFPPGKRLLDSHFSVGKFIWRPNTVFIIYVSFSNVNTPYV